jgi:hypothetical protein
MKHKYLPAGGFTGFFTEIGTRVLPDVVIGMAKSANQGLVDAQFVLNQQENTL